MTCSSVTGALALITSIKFTVFSNRNSGLLLGLCSGSGDRSNVFVLLFGLVVGVSKHESLVLSSEPAIVLDSPSHLVSVSKVILLSGLENAFLLSALMVSAFFICTQSRARSFLIFSVIPAASMLENSSTCILMTCVDQG